MVRASGEIRQCRDVVADGGQVRVVLRDFDEVVTLAEGGAQHAARLIGFAGQRVMAREVVKQHARIARRQSAWLQFVYGSPRLSAILAQDPRLLERWHHHYINRRFGRARRMEIVADHFRFAFVQLPEDMADGVYLHGGYRIGALTLKDGSELRIELRRPTGRSREGELALCLTNSHDQVLSSAVFTVADEGSSAAVDRPMRQLDQEIRGTILEEERLHDLIALVGVDGGDQSPQTRSMRTLEEPIGGSLPAHGRVPQ